VFTKFTKWLRARLAGPRSVPFARLPKSERARLFGAVLAGGAETAAGQRSTGNVAEGLLEIDMREQILELEPDASPLLILSKKANPEAAIAPKYSWFEDRLNARFDTLTAEKSSGETTLPVTTETLWAADDLMYNTRTAELVRVVSRASANLTVIRGVGSTAATIKTTDELIRVGSAAEEGAADKPARSRNPTEVSNYTQIFREPIDATATLLATRNRTTPRDWDRADEPRRHRAREGHRVRRRCSGVRPSTPRAPTRGARRAASYFATQNITDVGGEMTETEFWNATTPAFRYGSSKKLLLASSSFVSIITQYPRSKVIVTQPDPSMTYGIHMVQLITPFGKILNVVTHWLMEGVELSKQAWIIDLANVATSTSTATRATATPTSGRKSRRPGVDGKKDEYLTECGFEFAQALTHGKITGATS
jgi:hypothetical protein